MQAVALGGAAALVWGFVVVVVVLFCFHSLFV